MKLYTLVMVLALGLCTVVVGEASTTRRPPAARNSNHLAKSYKAQMKAAKKTNRNAARAARRGRFNNKLRARRPHA